MGCRCQDGFRVFEGPILNPSNFETSWGLAGPGLLEKATALFFAKTARFLTMTLLFIGLD